MLVVAGIIFRGKKILISQRKEDCAREPLKWEFPGGKIEKGETAQESLRREIMEELGIEIEVNQKFCESAVQSRGTRIKLVAFLATWKCGEAKALDVKDFKWIKPGELPGFDWARADRPIVKKLLESLPAI